METLVAPIPSIGMKKNMEPRLLGAKFGDGYQQTAPDGINTVLQVLEVSWNILTFEAGDEIDNFLTARHGEVFLWTKPRELSPRRWRCKTWSKDEQATTSNITATFEEQP